jgi:hypothetical protein
MRLVTSAQEQKNLIEECNLAIKENYIYNLKMLYPGLRIVCQDAESDKQQINMIEGLRSHMDKLPVLPEGLREMRRDLPVTATMHRQNAKTRTVQMERYKIDLQ